MPVTYKGDITISTVNPRNDDGTLATEVSPLDASKDYIVSGTTTIYNAQISLSVYDDNTLSPGGFRVLSFSPTPVQPTAPTSAPPVATPIAISPNDPSTGTATPVNWSVLL